MWIILLLENLTAKIKYVIFFWKGECTRAQCRMNGSLQLLPYYQKYRIEAPIEHAWKEEVGVTA